ncbi:MAG: HEAT repeat domain-containing protein, partial [Verrucomicrobiota bacterium]|nr:HEAT repeat domain-containing protein [Verrucomicrobiota bacterium]
MRSPLPLLAVLILACSLRAETASEPFEIREGDRVLFAGDALLERENSYGYLEARLHEQFPDRKFIVRNLSYSADTPLGWSRASFDPPAKGWERLKEQIGLVKPTVVFLGYGMAASLQELTDRSSDTTLNPDPARYGGEPMSAARFKTELAQLMDAITRQVRFVLLSPIRHEDLRKLKSALPDPTEHNKLLEQYSKAIEELAKERGVWFVDLANFKHRPPAIGARGQNPLTENGIHLSRAGHASAGREIAAQLGLKAGDSPSNEDPARRSPLLDAIVRKNDLWFHRTRPANATYLFGFRKHEQGQNAKEIEQFVPLVYQADEEIDKLKRLPERSEAQRNAIEGPGSPTSSAQTVRTGPQDARPARDDRTSPSPLPNFVVAEGYQIELWAENPLLEKPVQMNWDPLGRLWVASSSLYPQIAPGEQPRDKILIIEDTDRDGRADKSSVFADGLHMPTGVEPAHLPVPKGESVGQSPAGPPSHRDLPILTRENSAYVGQSTELLLLTDVDADGTADERRIVLSGFGTEDTHHIIHTLHWGPDGRLYFNQSIYIHSHLETPWGVVRLNSGGVLAYDPRRERVEVVFKGFCNPWGHQFDKFGQSFLTDGAGFQGISWGIRGAEYFTYENARKICPSISPGNYPKFCGLEFIYSPHFPADWQGQAVTCDYRAHRIVRFAIEDLSAAKENPASGYVTKEMPDLVRTNEMAFRPVDVKLGPDGALYVADWSNPVINHGEVDFRDPRRDKHRGRIWRITRKDATLVEWKPLLRQGSDDLLEKLQSENLWDREQARALLMSRGDTHGPSVESYGGKRFETARESETLLNFAWLQNAYSSSWGHFAAGTILFNADARLRPTAVRLVDLRQDHQAEENERKANEGMKRREDLRARTLAWETKAAEEPAKASQLEAEWKKLILEFEELGFATVCGNVNVTRHPMENAIDSARLSKLVTDPNPRVRLEAMRALARIPAGRSAELVLEAALNASANDPYYEYAAWLSINDLAKPWTDAIARGEWKLDHASAGPPSDPQAASVRHSREKQLEFGLKAIDPALAGATLAKLVDAGKLPLDGSGPWIELLGDAGGPAPLGLLFDKLVRREFSGEVSLRVLRALAAAARLRNVRPQAELKEIADFFYRVEEPVTAEALRVAGLWKIKAFVPHLTRFAWSESLLVRQAAVDGLRELGGAESIGALVELTADTAPPALRRRAVAALAALDLRRSLRQITEVLLAQKTEDEALETWRGLLTARSASELLKANLPRNLPKPIAVAGVRAAREMGKKGEPLLKLLAPMAGLSDT